MLNSSEYKLWIESMKDEDNSLIGQGSYIIVSLPPNRTALGSRQVWKKKYIPNKDIIKDSWIVNKEKTIQYKSRWVVQGYN